MRLSRVCSDERRCYFLPARVLLFLLGIMSHRACVEVDDAQSLVNFFFPSCISIYIATHPHLALFHCVTKKHLLTTNLQ